LILGIADLILLDSILAVPMPFGHITIADNVKIGAQSGINSSIKKEGAALLGSPAFNVSDYRKTSVHFRNLTNLVARIEELEKKLKDKE